MSGPPRPPTRLQPLPAGLELPGRQSSRTSSAASEKEQQVCERLPRLSLRLDSPPVQHCVGESPVTPATSLRTSTPAEVRSWARSIGVCTSSDQPFCSQACRSVPSTEGRCPAVIVGSSTKPTAFTSSALVGKPVDGAHRNPAPLRHSRNRQSGSIPFDQELSRRPNDDLPGGLTIARSNTHDMNHAKNDSCQGVVRSRWDPQDPAPALRSAE